MEPAGEADGTRLSIIRVAGNRRHEVVGVVNYEDEVTVRRSCRTSDRRAA